MHCLYIDLASHDGVLAYIKDDHCVHHRDVPSMCTDADLVAEVEKLLLSCESSYEHLTHIACVAGPGGFTSLRMSVAYANTLAHQLSIPAAPIHLSDAYHQRVSETDFLWLHSTKRHEIFIRGFGCFTSKWPESLHVQLEDVEFPEGAAWTGELIDDHISYTQKQHMRRLELEPVVLALPRIVSSAAYHNTLMEPWYGRSG